MRYGHLVLVPMALSCLAVLSNCGAYGSGFGKLGEAACPELGGSADALRAQYAANAQANAKIRAFVQAAKDLGSVAVQIEAEAAEACQRMAIDLGASPQEFAAKDEPGARANVACAVASARIDGILRQGISIRATATPPQCQASVQAQASCQGACDVQVDPGDIVARCDPGRLSGCCLWGGWCGCAGRLAGNGHG